MRVAYGNGTTVGELDNVNGFVWPVILGKENNGATTGRDKRVGEEEVRERVSGRHTPGAIGEDVVDFRVELQGRK